MDDRTALRIFEVLATLYAKQHGATVEGLTVEKKQGDEVKKVTA